MRSAGEPTLHVLCGKLASGKTTLARQIAAESDAVLFCDDIWLSRLFPDEIVSFAARPVTGPPASLRASRFG